MRDTVHLAQRIRASGYSPDLLIAVARGGWVVGRILSDCLGISDAFSLTIKSYRGLSRRAEEEVLQGLPPGLKGKAALVVDDVSDTGSTLKRAVELVRGAGLPQVRAATLYIKPKTSFIPDFYVRRVEGWVVFPYEYCETSRELRSMTSSSRELSELGAKTTLAECCREGAEA